jgi:hypothetical protein
MSQKLQDVSISEYTEDTEKRGELLGGADIDSNFNLVWFSVCPLCLCGGFGLRR